MVEMVENKTEYVFFRETTGMFPSPYHINEFEEYDVHETICRIPKQYFSDILSIANNIVKPNLDVTTIALKMTHVVNNVHFYTSEGTQLKYPFYNIYHDEDFVIPNEAAVIAFWFSCTNDMLYFLRYNLDHLLDTFSNSNLQPITDREGIELRVNKNG